MPRRDPKNKKPFISAIVPVFNEERTVKKVLETLIESPHFDEIIVVSDGSTDQSPKIIRGFKDRIKFINYKRNRGKAHAMTVGIKRSKGEIVTFWDADLLTLSQKHIDALIDTIVSGKAQAVIGYPALKVHDLSPFKHLAGERAYYRSDLLPHLKKMENLRFGVEVYLNDVLKDRKTVYLPWKDLRGLYKHEKFDSQNAVKEYVKEAIEITKALGQQSGVAKLSSQMIKDLQKARDIRELERLVDQITTKPIRDIWKNYVLKYFPKIKSK